LRVERHDAATVQRQEWSLVHVDHVRLCDRPQVSFDRERVDAVEVHLYELADGAPGNHGPLAARITGRRLPSPGVTENERANEFGPTTREVQADGASPVVHDQGHVVQPQVIDELLDGPARLARCVSEAGRRR
jgi:hypothetical protein